MLSVCASVCFSVCVVTGTLACVLCCVVLCVVLCVYPLPVLPLLCSLVLSLFHSDHSAL